MMKFVHELRNFHVRYTNNVVYKTEIIVILDFSDLYVVLDARTDKTHAVLVVRVPRVQMVILGKYAMGCGMQMVGSKATLVHNANHNFVQMENEMCYVQREPLG